MRYDPEVKDGMEAYGRPEITCPVCGRLRHGGDSFEAKDEGEHECESCGNTYRWSRNVSVDYSMEIIKPKKTT